jgi:hypothetical protein
VTHCARRRGVLLLERSEVLNCGSQAQSALRQTRDVGSAFWTLLLTQTWLTVFTCVMTIVSIAFFSYGERRTAVCSCDLHVSKPSHSLEPACASQVQTTTSFR